MQLVNLPAISGTVFTIRTVSIWRMEYPRDRIYLLLLGVAIFIFVTVVVEAALMTTKVSSIILAGSAVKATVASRERRRVRFMATKR